MGGLSGVRPWVAVSARWDGDVWVEVDDCLLMETRRWREGAVMVVARTVTRPDGTLVTSKAFLGKPLRAAPSFAPAPAPAPGKKGKKGKKENKKADEEERGDAASDAGSVYSQAGPARYCPCPPRHPPRFRPSFLEVNGMALRGERYLPDPTRRCRVL